MPLSSQAVLEKWGPIAAADPPGGRVRAVSFLVRRRAERTGRDAVRHAHTVNPVADTAPKVDSRCQTTLTGCSFVSLPSLIVPPRPKKNPIHPFWCPILLLRNVGLAWAALKMQSRIDAWFQ